MGGTMATIYTALYPEKVSGLISLASPYNFDTKDALSIFAQNLNVDAMVECFGQVPPEVLQYGFMIAQPGSVYGKMKSIYQNGDSEKRNRVFKHLERWLSDNIPFPGGVYREYITSLYQKNQLIKGEYVVNGRKVNLKNITVPFLNVTALRDNIVSSEAANPIMDVIGSEIKDKIEIDAGHIGVVMGKKAKEAWDCMSGWFYNRVIKKQ
jgi:polyhydroxyalkanoate synthase